jgi:hypothetical protein
MWKNSTESAYLNIQPLAVVALLKKHETVTHFQKLASKTVWFIGKVVEERERHLKSRAVANTKLQNEHSKRT